MKKICLIGILLLVFITGCDSKKDVVVEGKKINTASMEHKHCTRNGSMDNGEVNLNYDIYYTGEVLNIVKSVEEVTSSDESILDTYEEAYKKIHAYYEGLDHYDTSVVRNNNSVISTITIDYDNVSYDKLIEIEGEEDNIFEDRIPKVNKWLELGKKFGVSCKIVEE